MRKLTRLFIFGVVFLFSLNGYTKNSRGIERDHEEVVMRKIGHEILLNAHDSISLVRPVIHDGDTYRIQFESDFSFLPDNLVKTIDTILRTTLPYKHYLVQVESCTGNEVVYSYEINYSLTVNDSNNSYPAAGNLVPCSTRMQPTACYEIVIRFIKDKKQASNMWLYLLLFILLFLMVLYIYIKNRRTGNDKKIKIGAYRYDPKKMTLTHNGSTFELTSKESELLGLLYAFVNETVDKETIMNKVWDDEGDYVGRTLDVYVSKLRKKLENDPSVQLKNIRGIGYKLIVEGDT